MTRNESAAYLHNKLRAAGCKAPARVFPKAVCHELWDASGGWPGMLDRIAMLALDRAETLPITIGAIDRPVDVPEKTSDEAAAAPSSDIVFGSAATESAAAEPEPALDTIKIPEDNSPLVADAERVEETDADIAPVSDVEAADAPEIPRLFVTENGNTLQEIEFDQPRLLIGRSEHNDVSIESRFISRHHMLLVRHGASTFLMDLNSTNGTIVNSRRVSNHVLVDNDIISVGTHRIKFVDPAARQREAIDGTDFADTAIMKTLDDMRNLLEQENTAEFPQSENIPTYGDSSPK